MDPINSTKEQPSMNNGDGVSDDEEGGIDIRMLNFHHDGSSVDPDHKGGMYQTDTEPLGNIQQTMIIHNVSNEIHDETVNDNEESKEDMGLWEESRSAHMSNERRKQDNIKSAEMCQTFIEHATEEAATGSLNNALLERRVGRMSNLVSERNNQGCELNKVEFRNSKELASDEITSKTNMAQRFDDKYGIEAETTSKILSQKKEISRKTIVKPKNISQKRPECFINENSTRTDKKSFSKKQSDSGATSFKIRDEESLHKKRKFKDAVSTGTYDDFDKTDFESFSILDDLEEYGAVGGTDAISESTPQNLKHTNSSKPPKETPTSILHKKSAVSRKSSSVQFDDSVAVETFSQTEPASDCSPKAILAQGDGPDSTTQDPPGMYGPFPGPVSVERLNDIPVTNEADNTASNRIATKQTPSNEKDNYTKKSNGNFVRKDSSPRMLSPTQLLRQKQKNVTDKIIHSMSSQGANSQTLSKSNKGIQTEQKSKSNSHNVKEKLAADYDPYHIGSEQSTTSDGNFNVQQVSEDILGLVRVNSSDFVDPKYLADFPNSQAKISDVPAKSIEVKEKCNIVQLEDNGFDLETKEESNLGNLELFSYSSPSKLLRKIEDREKSESGNKELASFSYTSPSRLLQKVEDRVKTEEINQDVFSQRERNEDQIDQAIQYNAGDKNLEKKIRKKEPGYWFFKSSDSSFSGSFDAFKSNENFTKATDMIDSGISCSDLKENDITDQMFKDKAKARKIRERCRKKKKLDEVRNWTLENSHSSVLMLNDISSNQTQQGEMSGKIYSNGVSYSDHLQSLNDINRFQDEANVEDTENGNIPEDCENNDTRDEILHSDEVRQVVDYMNDRLTDFLIMIQMKRERGIPITIDDYRELELLQTTILYTCNRLNSSCETSDFSLTSENDQGIQEGGSSQIHIDMHDREVIRKQLNRLNFSLSHIERDMQCWSDSTMNRGISTGKKKHRDNVNESKSASAGITVNPKAQRQANSENEIKERQDSLNGKMQYLEMNDSMKGKGQMQDRSRFGNESEDSLFHGCRSQYNESHDSISSSRYPDNTASGYLGDRSASENSMPDITIDEYKRGQRFKPFPQASYGNMIGDDKATNVELNHKMEFEGQYSLHDNESYTDPSQSVSLGEYMSACSMSPNRDSDWTICPDGKESYLCEGTQHYGINQPPYFNQEPYKPFQWSRVDSGNSEVDVGQYIYPGYYLPETRDGTEASTEVQVGSQREIGQSNVRLTTNPYFKAQSSSEFEDDDKVDAMEVKSREMQKTTDVSYRDVTVSPRKIKLLTCVSLPDDLRGIQMDLGSTSLTVRRQDEGHVDKTVAQNMNRETSFLQEGSPERGQRLYGSSQNLDRRGDAGVTKRKQPGGRSVTPDSRSFMMEREVNESQNRKLQMEISTLQTENKILKEKNTRSQARISDLENQLSEAQEDLNALQDNLNQEVSDLSFRTKQEIERGRDEMQTKILVLTKENEALKAEVSSLEKRLESSQRTTDMARHNSEKARTIDAYKLELATMKEELNRVKALLNQSEKHLREEEERHTDTSKQVLKLTELKNALQQQSDSGGSGAIVDKQMKSLEKRLKVTEERLHQERSDRANNLSSVEDKLLTDNSRLQAVEKDLKRQLGREKEKNRNLDHRVKQLREENEKLRIALPFDESVLTSDKGKYDIPYGSHSSQRAETMKNISEDMNYILSQIEKQDGLSSGQEEEIICTLWNKRELAYKHLREYELQIEELQIHDNNNIVDGLKNLRDTYSQSEAKLRNMEENMEDMQALMSITESTYKEQLTGLVQERHEAFAKLKTAEDLLEAVRAENEMLRKNVALTQNVSGQGHLPSGEGFEALKQEVVSLEGKLAQVKRNNEKLEGELTTAKVQLDARDKALQDVQSELDLAYNRLHGEEVDDRKQIKIDKLTAQVSNYQIELKSWTDKYNQIVTEKSKLETELSLLKKSTSPPRGRQQKTEQIDSKVLQQMKDDIIEKEGRLTTVSKQLEDTENELQRVRQELYVEQMHTQEIEDELDTLQHTANQRAQMFEALSGTEREQLAQYQILKDTLDSVNQELAQKQAQIISLDVNLSGQRDKTVELEHEVDSLRRERKDSDELYTEEEQNSAHQLRIKVLEQERAQLKQELTQAYSAIQAAEEQYRTLQTECSQIEQELVKEKTIILQITAEKGEVEQHLEELAEEHDALISEKSQVEEDLIKLETKLQEILQKYEAEAKRQHSDFTKQYPNLPPEGRKLVSELDSLRLVLEGKNREIEMLKDKLNRCNIEIDFLNRKVELVHNDSISNREDVARMISELTLKMKEAVSTREVNQYLVEERTKLQNEKAHLERELEQERKTNDERKKEITNVIRKIERTETHKKSAEKDSKDKEGTIANLEVELRNSKHDLDVSESENTQLKNKLEHVLQDLKNLTTINESLETRLTMEKETLSEEKRSFGKLKEDHSSLTHDFQLLQHDHKVLSDKYEAELRNVENLHKDLDEVTRENMEMRDEIQTAKLDIDNQKGELAITKESVQKLTQDKGSIYQDYESMCRTLTEKERQLNDLKERSEEKLELTKREHAQERVRLEEHKNMAVQECEAAKKEMNSLNEQLKQKEIQLNTFGKTLQELETTTRQKKSLESQLHSLESSSGDSKLLLEGQRKEIMALNESLAKQQERTIRLESENHNLQADLKTEKDSANREIHELKITLNELKSQHENERHYLNDNLAQTQSRLRSVETSLASVSKERDQLQGHQRLKEKAVEDLQAQFNDESTGRRLAEQSVGSLRIQLEDAKNAKNVAEAKFTEMQTQLNKAETQHKMEQERNQKLLGKVQELQAVSHTTETSAKAKSEQVETLQKEISKLKQLLDSQKQSHVGKMKKSALEFKQQLDLSQEEKDKLVLQVQQIAADLDTCREQVANKNKENLKLQEECLMMEDNLRESKTKQKQAEETLKVEMEKQSQLSSRSVLGLLIDEERFRDQDEELKRLRNFLAKKVEESGDADKSMWHEMNRVIQELSKQMQNHLDAQRTAGSKEGEGHSVVRYKKQIAELQSDLNTEKSLHHITKTSLQALEEDCQRLRQQLQTWRKRDPHSSEKKYKNRMEAINAIIARSQTQAQALLASGGYLGNSMLSPRTQPVPGYGSPQHNDSPDNSYSEDLSIASLPPLHYGSSKHH